MGDDRSEQLACQIREALGPLNDESDALTLLIGKLRARLAQLEAVAEAARAYEAEQIPRNRERLFNTLAALRDGGDHGSD